MLRNRWVPLMEIPWDRAATFEERANKFLGMVRIETEGARGTVPVHVHDPGRLAEILYRGNSVLLRRTRGRGRKTGWDVVAGRLEAEWVFVHSGYHSKIAERIILNPAISPFSRVVCAKPEVRRGDSRLDFLVTKGGGARVWVEVKSCTLAVDGVALFPDAPTARGRRHLRDLVPLRKNGERAALLVLVFRCEAERFAPNQGTDSTYASLFYEAMRHGVEVYPLVLAYQDSVIHYLRRISVCPSHPAERL